VRNLASDRATATGVARKIAEDIHMRQARTSRDRKGRSEQIDLRFLPRYRFWRVPSRSGFILHGFFAAPILMHYGIVDAHDVTCFSAGGFEEGYLQDNFYKDRIHVFQDSDELGMSSLTPRAVALAKPVVRRRTLQRSRWAQQLSIRVSLGVYARGPRDLLKRDLLPIRWHAEDLDEAWHLQERSIAARIEAAVGDYYALADGPNNKRFPPHFGFRFRYLVGDILTICVAALPYLAVLKQAAAGDRYAWSRSKQHVSGLFGAGLSTRFGR
jgi:hypothetical protein